jgi:hypothetical protein
MLSGFLDRALCGIHAVFRSVDRHTLKKLRLVRQVRSLTQEIRRLRVQCGLFRHR